MFKLSCCPDGVNMNTPEPKIVTYQSANSKPEDRWLAFCVGNDGEQILVRMRGSTEQEAIDRAKAWWNGEQVKWAKMNGGFRQELEPQDTPAAPIRNADGWPVKSEGWGVPQTSTNTGWNKPKSEHGMTGKVWMINHATKERKRVDEAQVGAFIFQGWERGGPKTPFREG
jgi:hypothetical protein